MKQTAVQWLEGQLNIWQTIADEDTNATLDVVRGWIDKLKAMEKEQIIDSFGVGCQVESTRLIGYQDIAEQYYKETYNPNIKSEK